MKHTRRILALIAVALAAALLLTAALLMGLRGWPQPRLTPVKAARFVTPDERRAYAAQAG